MLQEMENQGRPGYADVFESNKSFISKIIGGKDKAFLAFNDKDFKKIEEYIHILESESTKSLHGCLGLNNTLYSAIMQEELILAISLN